MKLSITVGLLIITLQSAVGQVYPFYENFNSITPMTSPPGWTTTFQGFLVYPNHGDGSPGLAQNISPTGLQADSVSTPLIGPITAASAISFKYRVMEAGIYPCCAHTMGTGDVIEFYATSGPLQLPLFVVDSTNHIPDTAFTTIATGIGGLAGQVGKLMIVARAGSGDFYVDFDDFIIADVSSINSANTASIDPVVYPNPVSDEMKLKLQNVPPDSYTLKLITASGKVVNLEDVTVTGSGSEISVGQLSAGIYFLQLTGVHNNFLLRFVVKS